MSSLSPQRINAVTTPGSTPVRFLHPAFSDAAGKGTGDLLRAIEDPGDFMHVGEFRDAMDLARERLGLAAVAGDVVEVETTKSKRSDSPSWEVDEHQFPVRVKAKLGGAEQYVYAEFTDLITGPGKPRMPNEQILSAHDRQTLMDPDRGGVLFSGEKLLELQKDVRGKRVLVMSLGPTGGWTAKAAAEAGASRVDFCGSAGGELESARGQVARHPDDRAPGNDGSLNSMKEIDRLQGVLDGEANVHITLDRVLKVEPGEGGGATVTFAHGTSQNAEVYRVHYDVIAMTMGYTQAQSIIDPATADRMIGTDATVADMLGQMKMTPQPGTRAPVTQDVDSGRVRVMGIAAMDAVNVPDGLELDDLRDRQRNAATKISADSPNAAVLEATGLSIRRANQGRQ